jgi:diguanylate cyclase (GGDEF)-like protein/PAS domain S-box-containing protein
MDEDGCDRTRKYGPTSPVRDRVRIVRYWRTSAEGHVADTDAGAIMTAVDGNTEVDCALPERRGHRVAPFLAASPPASVPAAPRPNARRYPWPQLSLLGMVGAIVLVVAFTDGVGRPLVAAIAAAYLVAGLLWVRRAKGAGATEWQWRSFLVAGMALIAVYSWVTGIPHQVMYAALGAAAALAVISGIRIHRPARSLPWILLASGLFIRVAGDVIWLFDDTLERVAIVSPGMIPLIPLPGAVILVVAAVLLVRQFTSSTEHSGVIDASIIATGAGILCWVLLIAPQTDFGFRSLREHLGSIAYPLVDVLIIALVIHMLLATGVRARSYHLITGSLAILVFADLTHAHMALSESYVIVHRVEAFWLLSYLLLGLAALHPSMNAISFAASDPTLGLSRRRVILLGSATFLAPVAMLHQRSRGEDVSVPVIIFGSTLLALLVIVRLNTLVRAHLRAVMRERILRNAAASLVAATSRSETFDAAFAAVRALIEEASVLILLRDELTEPFTISSSTAAIDFHAPRRNLSLGALSSPLRRALQEGRSVRLANGEASWLGKTLGFPQNTKVLLLEPLVVQQELRGIMVVGNGNVTDDVVLGINALGSHIALAIERETLVHDRSLSQSEERFRSLVRHSSDIIAIIESDGRFRYVSPSAERILGRSPEDLIATDICSLVLPEQQIRVRSFIEDVAQSAGNNPMAEFRMEHADGSWRYFEAFGNSMLHDPSVAGIVLNIRDITERKRAEDLLAHQAFHDTLTNLPNRALFLDRLSHALARVARHRRSVAVLFLDLDRFKVINDSLGHDMGDELLILASERILTSMRQGDTCARLGGDEFTVLLEDITSVDDAVAVAERIVELFRAPFLVRGHSIFVSTSIGIAISRRGIDRPSDLLREADVAMYSAKTNGKAGFAIFEPSMGSSSSKRLDLENSLREAIEKRQFTLLYQPQIEMETGRLASFEALVRWVVPDRGIVSPGEFIPLAEETGLILPLGRWVLEEACRQGRMWQDLFPANPPEIAVNLSIRQFQDPNLVNDVARALRDSGLRPPNLALEITETGLMEAGVSNMALLDELKALGIHLAIDDFGIGYSSLSYLKGFPIDALKIDRSFIQRLDENSQDTAIVQAITSLAHTLGMSVVAEGIETAGQFNRLRSLGCDYGQGYLFARPLDPAAAGLMLNQYPRNSSRVA